MNLTEKINCKEEYTGELVNSKAVMGWEVLSVKKNALNEINLSVLS